MCYISDLFFQQQDTYKLTIIASDMGGQSGGNTGTGEITVKILDINDNIPTLEKESVGATHNKHFYSSFIDFYINAALKQLLVCVLFAV